MSERFEPHAVLNSLPRAAAAEALRRACGSARWVEGMLAHRPFPSTDSLYARAAEEWRSATEADVLEALARHPQIGEDLAALRQRFPKTAGLSEREQAGVAGAAEQTLVALRDANAAYRARFGFTFIICATGKTAEEMLSALRQRLANDRRTELVTAAAEQAKITQLRLEGLSD